MKGIFFYFLQITLGLILAFSSKAVEASVCSESFGTTNETLQVNESSNRNSTVLRNNQERPSEEADLTEKGYRPIYTQGLDRAVELIALGKKLRANKIDPYKTHIPELADSIQKHIDFIHQSLLSRKKEITDSKQEKAFNTSLKILKEIKQEALEKIKNKQVTYAWNFETNIFLALVATIEVFQDKRKPQTLKTLKALKDFGDIWNIIFDASNEVIQERIAEFPEDIYFPTIKEMGIMGFNRSFTERINFVGLLGNNEIDDPINFFLHDINHGKPLILDNRLELWKKRYPLLEKKFKNLPLRKREMAEMAYFLIIHENPDTIDHDRAVFDPVSLSLSSVRSGILDELLANFIEPNEFSIFLPKDIRGGSKKKIKKYVEESLNVFADLFDPFEMDGLELFDVFLKKQEMLLKKYKEKRRIRKRQEILYQHE